MLNLSNCTIKLGKSANYLRIALLLYVCALLLVLSSNWALLLKLIIGILLLSQLIQIIRYPVPHSHYLMLIYNGKDWLLHDRKERQTSYRKLRIVIDTGLFFLLELQNENQRKMIVIFSDQVTKNDYRLLKITEFLL